MSQSGVRVLRILGREYSIKAPAGEERTLQDAAALLQAEIAANQKKFPTSPVMSWWRCRR
ncbi:MAG: hypothetical protein GAK43_02478 [Stenotrophomonas maltophilia]|nr:MAG: hypothetical protein GAK43_02478 [Stenotrophomonas maltophilia]